MGRVAVNNDSLPNSYDPNSGGDYASVLPGRYHVRIAEIRDNAGKSKTDVGVKFEVLNGTVAEEIGKFHDELFATQGKQGAVKRFLMLCIACALTTAEELEACKKGSKSPEIDTDDLLNCQLIIGVEKDEFTGNDGKVKTRHKVNYDICSTSHPNAAEVPQSDLDGEGGDGEDPFSQS